MKFIVIGKQCSGKHEVLEECAELGLVVGHEFSTVEVGKDVYIDPAYIKYGHDDALSIFETNSYLYFLPNYTSSSQVIRGMSQYEFDNAEVICLTPDAMSQLDHRIFDGSRNIVIWMDNNRDQRIHRFVEEGREYDFKLREQYESSYDRELGEFACGHEMLYFYNEDPRRVATIINAMAKHEELVEAFIKNFK